MASPFRYHPTRGSNEAENTLLLTRHDGQSRDGQSVFADGAERVKKKLMWWTTRELAERTVIASCRMKGEVIAGMG